MTSWRQRADPAPHSESFRCAIVILTTLAIAERNSGVRLEARFAFAAEHPDHYAYERDDKDKKVDRPSHGCLPRYHPAVPGLRPSIGIAVSDPEAAGVRKLTVEPPANTQKLH